MSTAPEPPSEFVVPIGSDQVLHLNPEAPAEFHLTLPEPLTLNWAAFDQCVDAIDRAETKEQLATLAEQIKIVALQLRSINGEMTTVINDIRDSIAALAAAHATHFHMIPAGMTTVVQNADPVRVLVAEPGIYQGKGQGVGLLSLQGTSGPRH